ncbi:MAG: hypothetical protein ACOH5I_05045 [Oligoflexus sp.]
MSKWLIRTGLSAILWVFILSVEVQGRSLFSYANEYLVRNQLVQNIDQEIGKLWSRISQTAEMAFSTDSEEEKSRVTF